MKKIIAICLVVVLLIIAFPTSVLGARDVFFENHLAGDLKKLGLFQGVSENDFDLDRAPTRLEALVMLVRLMGLGNSAQNSTASHPFTDVPEWANSYVGFAYQKGLTNGISDTVFGTADANAQTYLTFVLRALGYSDVDGKDFTWDNPFPLAEQLGLISPKTDLENFLRADVVLVSYAALEAKTKGTGGTLSQKLMENGLFSFNEYNMNYDRTALKRFSQEQVQLTSEEIYTKCSPSVFRIDVYNRADELISTGNGFFIEESGVAVTDFHVIKNGYSAKITMLETGAVYQVSGVYDYSIDYDWAIIQVAGSGFSVLPVGDAAIATDGAMVYTVGEQKNSNGGIATGKISNANNWIGNICYIATDVAAANQVCGSALVNKSGEVIGIVSDASSNGQNALLALPISVIENHLKGNLITLASLTRILQSAVGTEHTPREEAYALLLSVIDAMENETINGKRSYAETVETENGMIEYSLVRNDDHSIDVTIWEISGEDTYYTSLTLEPYDDNMFVYYSYNHAGDSFECTGLAQIHAPTYSVHSDLRFIEADANIDAQLDAAICHENVVKGLQFVQRIYERFHGLGDYTISDLGFLNF
ncbi:MAG: hypothetical protein E7413_07740 [Ruminococcaceae bacterium]|nr:hypothetical protein [Oscillospiraceae bacterium]